MIEYLKGDATKPVGDGVMMIVHIVNTRGGWGRGFVLAVSKRWKRPEEAYREWFRNERSETASPQDFILGSVQFVKVEDSLWVANMLAQEGYGKKKPGAPLVRYDALRTCLETVAYTAEQMKASVHMPRIATGLGAGSWAVVERIVERALSNLAVYVYDLPAAGKRGSSGD